MSRHRWRLYMAWAALGAALLLPWPAQAAINCSLVIPNANLVYSGMAAPMADLYVNVRCTRLLSDAQSVGFRITADAGFNGANGNTASPTRALRLVGGSATVPYVLHRYYPGSCRYISNWGAPPAGTNGVFESGVVFGTNASFAGGVLPYCVVVTMDAAAPAGNYTDQFNVTASYWTANGPIGSSSTTVTVSLNSPGRCSVSAVPALRLDYRSFSPLPVTAATTATVQCSAGLPWTASLSPASGRLLDLDYTLSLSPAEAAGTGSLQSIQIQATVPAGRSGTCGSGVCTGRATHTLTITY